ncbi:hypothetical protein E4N81_12595 [Treponema denticola]|uniref:hypothetical protein n=1 Tax=Treponema denticola TaxID=158 RepID=UPI003D6EC90D
MIVRSTASTDVLLYSRRLFDKVFSININPSIKPYYTTIYSEKQSVSSKVSEDKDFISIDVVPID